MLVMLGCLYVSDMVIGENEVRGIDGARHSLFVKVKHDLEVLPPTHGALELRTIKLRYGFK